MNRLLTIITNPFVISVPLVVLVIVLIPPLFNKYNLELVGKHKGIVQRVFFHDLDQDGLDEFIQLGFDRDSHSLPYLHCNTDFSLDSGYRFINQLNFDKEWLYQPQVTFMDFDDNSFDEVLFFCRSGDSLFLLIIEPYEIKSIREHFIAKCTFLENTSDFSIHVGEPADLNSDGYKDFLFSITAGHSLTPRSLYFLDIYNDTLHEKDVRYANLQFINNSVEVDPEKGPVITTSSFASQNYYDTTGNFFHDLNAWLMVFDKELDFMFEPLMNSGEKTNVIAYPVMEDSAVYIYAYFRDYIPDGQNELRKYDLMGNLIDKKFYGFNDKFELTKLESGRLIFLDYIGNKAFEVQPDLSLNKIHSLKPIASSVKTFLDIDQDKNPERITCDLVGNKLIVSQLHEGHNATIDFPYFGNTIRNISTCNFKDLSCNLFIQAGKNFLFYKYSINKLYYLKYPVYLSIYLFISLFLYFLLKLQKKNLQKRYEQEKRMTELELLTIKNQIDPHFTFNAINTLSSVFYKEDKKAAHQFLVDFSALIRNTLNNSKKIAITLKDEIDFVQNYLRLQQFRYSDKFDFRFNIDKEVDLNTTVPRMIIQTFAENAVKHGLVNKEGKGNLTIDIRPVPDNHPMTRSHRMNISRQLLIEITDDGIGRERSKQVKGYKQISTGHGHLIIERIVEMYNRLNESEVSFEINDLTDPKGNDRGTCVKIVV